MPLRSATARDLQLVDAAQKGDHNLVVGLLHLGASPWADVPKGFSALHAAAKQGSLQAVQALLQRGAFVNALTDDGSTALNLAAHHGPVDVMGVLLAAHADVSKADNSGRTPLHGATSFGHTDMMQQMLDAGANIDAADSKGLMPLHVACTSGKQQAAQLLVSRGASLEATCSRGFTPLHHASQKGHLEVAQLLVDANASVAAVTGAGRAPLYLAASAGHNEVVQLLVSSGAQPGAKDSTGLVALHAASANNHFKVVQCLLAADSTPDHVDAQGPDGAPLHMACLKGCKEVVSQLIEAGADVNARTPSERTPMHQAVICGHSEVLKQLLAAGADPGALTRTGGSGLHVAAMRGYSPIIKQLLAALGAEQGSAALEAVYGGKTPLQHAVYNRQASCMEVLLAAGADPDKLCSEGATMLHRAVEVEFAAAVPLVATPRNMRRLWKGQTALKLALSVAETDVLQTFWWGVFGGNVCNVARALVTAGAPLGLVNAAGTTPLSMAGSSKNSLLRALLPAMVRRECARYKQLQQGRMGRKRQRQQQEQQDEEEGVEEQEPAAVLAAVFAAVSALLEATAAAGVEAASGAEGAAAGVTAAAGEGSSHEPLLGCFKAVMEVLGEAAARDLLQQLLSKAPGPSGAAAASSRTLLLYQVFVKAWLAELQPLMQQRWGMTNRLAALVTDPLQQHPKPRRRPDMPAPYNERWALSQSALLAAQASAAAAAGHWEWLVLCLEQLMGLHKPSAEVVLCLLEQEQRHEGARDLSGMCMALLSAWTAAQQQVAVMQQRELAEAVVVAVQGAQQQQAVTGRGRRQRQLV